MNITLEMVKQLREQTGAGYMDTKRALEKADGNVEKAVTLLREKGVSIAKKKAARAAGEGVVSFYLHSNERIGVMVEVNCESEFAAETETFKELAHNLAIHIAAMEPAYVSRADIAPETIRKERSLYTAQARNENKPEAVIPAITEGRLKAFYRRYCLLDQPYCRQPDKSVNDVIVEYIAVLKENITVRRFIRYELGEQA